MSPRKMKSPDLIRLTIAVGVVSVMLCAPVAYAGIADDAIDAAARVERLSIIGVLTCGIITAWTAFFWLLRIIFTRDAAERRELQKVVEANTAAMMACHDARQARGGL
jgi:hypothetical protein